MCWRVAFELTCSVCNCVVNTSPNCGRMGDVVSVWSQRDRCVIGLLRSLCGDRSLGTGDEPTLTDCGQATVQGAIAVATNLSKLVNEGSMEC